MLQADLNGYKFKYTENGNGETLVLVHGSASDSRTWEKQVPEFGKYYHTLAYSRRYHWPNTQIDAAADYSMMEHLVDLEEFIKYPVNSKTVHLIGHSYGAFLCLLLAIKNPELIRTLTLAEPPAITLYVSNVPKPLELLKLLLTKPKLAAAILKFGAKGIAPATKALHQNDFNTALEVFGKATLGVQPYLNLSLERRKQAETNLIKADLLGSGFLPLSKNKIKKLNLPTLLISGQNSPKLFQYLLKELNKLIPGSELQIIPDASHIMHEDNPSYYNATVLSFLKRTSND